MADSYESQNNSTEEEGGRIGEQNQIEKFEICCLYQTRKPGNFSRLRGEQL